MERLKNMQSKVETGEISSLNRDRGTIIEKKLVIGGGPSTWFLKVNIEGTLQTSCTPKGIMKDLISKEVNKHRENGKILVVERAGAPITAGLIETNPFKTKGCTFKDENCIVEGDDCSQNKVVYNITCDQCSEVVDNDTDNEGTYIGMTATSIHNRMLQHLQYQKRKDRKGPMTRHDIDFHNGVKQNYTAKVFKKERKLLNLCMNEALSIEKNPEMTKLNERNECGRGGIVRLRATRVT